MSANTQLRAKYDAFRKADEPIAVMQRYNILRVTNPLKHFIFVEGSSDKIFYQSTKDVFLSKDVEYLFSVKRDAGNESRILVGKEAVLFCYTKIKRDFKSDMDRCAFIVDRDYDCDLRLTDIPIKTSDKPKISMTVGHSFENYFFYSDNLKKVFDICQLTDLDYISFQERLKEYVRSILEFFAANAVITESFKLRHLRYKKKKTDEMIFSNDIIETNGIHLSELQEEINHQMDFISGQKLTARYKYYLQELNKNPALYIRGHNVFNYLVAYLKEYHSINLDPFQNQGLYRRIIGEFQIEIERLNKPKN